MRTCAACGARSPRERLIRFRNEAGRLTPDFDGVGPGRGAWACPTAGCIAALPGSRGLARALHGRPAADRRTLFELLAAQSLRTLARLVRGAERLEGPAPTGESIFWDRDGIRLGRDGTTVRRPAGGPAGIFDLVREGRYGFRSERHARRATRALSVFDLASSQTTERRGSA